MMDTNELVPKNKNNEWKKKMSKEFVYNLCAIIMVEPIVSNHS